MQTVQRPIPVRVLLALTTAVLLAHMLVLKNTPLALDNNGPVGTRVFTTRTLQIDPAPAMPEVQSAPAPKPPPRRAISSLAHKPSTPGLPPPPLDARPAEPVAEVVPPVVNTAAPASAPEAAEASTTPASEPAPQSAPTPAPLPKDATLEARAYTVPGSIRLKFNATGQRARMNYSALGELLWLLRDDHSYDARLEAGAFLIGSRVGSSTGRITADGLAPSRYSEKTKSELAAHFERDKGRITFSANTPDAVLLPGAQDRLSVFIQLAAMVAGDPAKYPLGTTIAIQTVSQRAAEPWVFAVEEQAKLYLPGGEQTTLKLTRVPRREFDQKAEIWLAPALAYLPARIRITEANGDFLDLQWRSTASP